MTWVEIFEVALELFLVAILPVILIVLHIIRLKRKAFKD